MLIHRWLHVCVCNVDVTCWMLCFDFVSCWRCVMVVTIWCYLVSALLVGGQSLALVFVGVACWLLCVDVAKRWRCV